MKDSRQIEQNPSTRYLRAAGILYLVIISTGLFSELFVRGSLVVAGDASATLANIENASSLFVAGFVADTIMLLCDVGLAVLLYVLLKPIHVTLALFAMVFRLVQASVLSANMLNYIAVLVLIQGPAYDAASLDSHLSFQVTWLLDIHAHGYDLGLVFFACSNLALGYLIVRSNRWPTVLGLALQAAAVVYLVGSYTRFVMPQYLVTIELIYLVPFVAEFAFCLWLLLARADGDGSLH